MQRFAASLPGASASVKHDHGFLTRFVVARHAVEIFAQDGNVDGVSDGSAGIAGDMRVIDADVSLVETCHHHPMRGIFWQRRQEPINASGTPVGAHAGFHYLGSEALYTTGMPASTSARPAAVPASCPGAAGGAGFSLPSARPPACRRNPG